MITPLIIIGGIVFGVFTPTEAAAFSAIYAYLIGVLLQEHLNERSASDFR